MTMPSEATSGSPVPQANATPAQPVASPSVFDAAKSIAQTLGDMKTKTEQERALRYAAEELGITLAAPSAAPHHAPHHAPIPPPTGGSGPQKPLADRPKDIKSFKEEKLPKSDNQYAAVVAYYYRFEAPEGQRKETINAETLQESTRQSGWKRLAAPRNTLNNAMAVGYLDRSDRGEYKINTVGENLVAMTLPGGADNGGGSGTRSRGGRKKVAKRTSMKPRGRGR